ncbi:MAG TPA: MBL fold metallo-hydrolase [Candidatus Binatia bacterium]|jgi:glyoxylase-like metal-dependent hydrolase (beta-lactamase superfamily II)
MKIEANVWQKVPGTPSVDIFPIIPKANCISSNCFIFSAPDALVVIDPGASTEQTRQINRILTEALAVSRRPIFVFLTHCHQDHSQEAGLELPAGIEVKRFAHQVGVEALKHRDRNLTTAYLYPWNPEICTAQFEGVLFDSSPKREPALHLADGRQFELHTEPIAMPHGATLKHQWLSLGAGNRLEIYHTPGHSACSISLRVGSLLLLGDLPFAVNPGVCGLDGWNHTDLLQTLRKVDWLLEMPDITVCCPGHGYCVSAQSMREKLRLMETEASNLTDVPLMDAERISALKIYADELLEETSALLTIFSGRLYTVSYYLSLLEEDSAASRVLTSLDIDQIDRILSDFRRIAEAFSTSTLPEWTVVLKGVQVARSLQKVLSAEPVQQLLDVSLVNRAQRRLDDFLSVVRGLQFLQMEQSGAVNQLIAELLRRVKEATIMKSTDLMEAVDDDQAFLQAITRRLGAHSPLRDIEFEFAPATQETNANIGAERLDDLLTSLMEGMAGIGVRRISIATRGVASGQVEIRLSSLERIDPAAFGKRRLDLYNRTLGWLGGRLEYSPHEASAEFVIKLPVLQSV